MRNLKRVLALAMALVMILGMMVIGSSAASYSDATAIDAKYAEAVEVLSDMGVFKGTGAGFAPKQILSRAEAAALIYRVITGDVKDLQVKNYDYAAMKDVPAGEWYTGYVTYANNGGYIKGDDAGNFNPHAQVTGIQVLAIMLRAAGYGQNGEYEGAAWKDNILTDALDLKITKGIAVATLDAPASRELVAQLLFNAITSVKMVSYTPALGYIAANITGMAKSQTLGEKVFSLKPATTSDEWGRPYYGWTYKIGVVPGATMFVEEHTAYTVAISDCQIAVDMGKKKDYTTTFYNNGVKTANVAIDVSAQAPVNGAQGTQIEVYDDRVVVIDTYLAEVGVVTNKVTDKAGHVVIPASTALKVYKFNSTGINTVMAGADFKKGDMILVNINECAVDADGNYLYTEAANDDKVVYPVDYAPSFVGAQTELFFNVEKHEVNDTVYFDAEHFYLDPAGYQGGNWTWYMDQFGNLIGNAAIINPSSYGVIKSIQWINVEDQAGYAKATIVDMTGAESVMKIAKIDGATAVYGAWFGADFDVENGVAEISTNIADNYTEYCGLDLYEIKETKAGAILTSVAEVTSADVATNVPVIIGNEGNVLVDNDTQYLIRKATAVPGVYTFAPVVGYTNVADYTGATVDYVNLDRDPIAEYVYVTGTPDSAVADEYVYITNNWNIQLSLKTIGGKDFYTVTGVVRADGSTAPLYIDGAIAVADVIDFLTKGVDKLYEVTTVDGLVYDLTTDLVEVTYAVRPTVGATYAYFAGSVSVIGNGMIVTEDGRQWNVNATTAVANKNGVGTIADLTAANLAGKYVYVVGIQGAPNYYTAKAIFITTLDSVAAAKELAILDLVAYINAEVKALDATLTNAAANTTTSMAATGWGTGYETMAAVVAKWSAELNAQTSVAAVEAKLAAQKAVFDSAEAAKIYVYGDASSDVTVVATAAELIAFAADVNGGNNYTGKTVVLAADIDLAGQTWAPINNFKGTFDGNGYTISNLTVEGTTCVGLFGSIVGTVKNVTIVNAKVTGTHYVAAVVGYAYGVIDNCSVIGASISCVDTVVDADMDGDKAGAIVGYICGEPQSSLTNCYAENVTIVANRDAGKIAGMVNGTVTVSGNAGENVTVTWSNYGTGANLGGPIGRQ